MVREGPQDAENDRFLSSPVGYLIVNPTLGCDALWSAPRPTCQPVQHIRVSCTRAQP